MSKQVPKMALVESLFYKDEILPDFQIRQKAALKGKESLPVDVPNEIGMRAINPKSPVKKYLVECMSSSSIHGLNHLVAPNRHPVERVLSGLIVLGCLTCLILLSFLFWNRYQTDAITIAVNKELHKFPMMAPALFVCPVENIVPSKIPEVFRKYGIEHTPETENFFTFLSNVTYSNVLDTPLYDRVPSENWTDILYDLKKDISPDVLSKNDPREAWVWTERGLCFATRSLTAQYYSKENWNDENMQLIPDTKDLPVYRPDDVIVENLRIEHTSMISLLGPKDYLIYDSPMKLVESKRLQSATVQMYRVGMLSTYGLSVRQRGCKVYEDGGLKSIPYYSENACYMECRMKVILKICHCRPHFAKPIEGQMTCLAAQLRCIGRKIDKIFLYDFAPESCGCLEKCNAHIYDLKLTSDTALDNEPITTSVMNLRFKFPSVVYSRELSYDLFNFLSSIGGAAGLFLGASVLSFVELLFFATFRLYFRMRELMANREMKLGWFKWCKGPE